MITTTTLLTLYITPDEAKEARQSIVDLINSAKVEIRVAAYGFTDPDITEALINAFVNGVDVKALFDHTQSTGPAEKGQLLRLETAGLKRGKDYWVGTSSQHGQILHWKNIMVDQTISETGSLNYSASAFFQENTVEIITNPEIAKFWIDKWNEAQQFVVSHDQRYNVAETT